MKAVKILIVLASFVFLSCHNQIFEDLTGLNNDKNGGGNVTVPSGTSDESSNSNKLEAPTVTYDSDGYLKWNSVTGATNYEIRDGSSSSTSSMSSLKTISSTSTQYYLGSKYDGKYFCVRAYNSNTRKYSDYSNVVHVSSASTQLATPVLTYDNGYLKWNSVTGATDYFIYSSSNSSYESMTYMADNDVFTSYYVGGKHGKYFCVVAYNSSTEKYSDHSNIKYVP